MTEQLDKNWTLMTYVTDDGTKVFSPSLESVDVSVEIDNDGDLVVNFEGGRQCGYIPLEHIDRLRREHAQ